MTDSGGSEPDMGEAISLLPPSQRGGQAILETLWQTLRPADPVQQIARKVMNGGRETVTRADAELLLDTLEQTRAKPLWSRDVVFWLLGGARVSPEHTEREAAVWTLAHLYLPPDLQARAGTVLARILAGEGLRNRRDDPVAVGRGFMRGMLFFIALTPLLLPFIGEMRHSTWITAAAMIFGAELIYATLFSPLCIGIATKQNKDHLSRLRFAAATTLGPLVRPEAVYALAKTVRERSKDNLQQAALHSLKGTLPTILPEHYGVFRRNGSQFVRVAQSVERLSQPSWRSGNQSADFARAGTYRRRTGDCRRAEIRGQGDRTGRRGSLAHFADITGAAAIGAR